MAPAQFNPLQPIGENIHFFQPAVPDQGVNNNNSPALITLCTWLGGATTPRIQKYITGYRALYPNSAILLITTYILEISVLPFSALQARLAPARDVIRRAYQAAALSLPHSAPVPVQTAGKVLLYPVIGIINALQQNGWMSSVRDLRAQLNHPGVFGTTAARLYLYSTADRMVGWEDVEAHMKEARSGLGCVVEGVAFSDSSHCALVRDHPGRYWSEISRFWTKSSGLMGSTRSRL